MDLGWAHNLNHRILVKQVLRSHSEGILDINLVDELLLSNHIDEAKSACCCLKRDAVPCKLNRVVVRVQDLVKERLSGSRLSWILHRVDHDVKRLSRAKIDLVNLLNCKCAS